MAVAKTIEISADSPTSFAEAVKVGVAKASETVHGIEGAYVKELKVVVRAEPETLREALPVTAVAEPAQRQRAEHDRRQ